LAAAILQTHPQVVHPPAWEGQATAACAAVHWALMAGVGLLGGTCLVWVLERRSRARFLQTALAEGLRSARAEVRRSWPALRSTPRAEQERLAWAAAASAAWAVRQGAWAELGRWWALPALVVGAQLLAVTWHTASALARAGACDLAGAAAPAPP
jgi:fatty acid desaturase